MRIILFGGWLVIIWGVFWVFNGVVFVIICFCQVLGVVYFIFFMDEEVIYVYEVNCCY